MSGALIDVRLQTRGIDQGRQMDRLGEQRRRAVAAFVGRLVVEEGVQAV